MWFVSHALTAVLVVLNLMGIITMSWWLVFLPSILAFVVAAIALAIVIWTTTK